MVSRRRKMMNSAKYGVTPDSIGGKGGNRLISSPIKSRKCLNMDNNNTEAQSTADSSTEVNFGFVTPQKKSSLVVTALRSSPRFLKLSSSPLSSASCSENRDPLPSPGSSSPQKDVRTPERARRNRFPRPLQDFDELLPLMTKTPEPDETVVKWISERVSESKRKRDDLFHSKKTTILPAKFRPSLPTSARRNEDFDEVEVKKRIESIGKTAFYSSQTLKDEKVEHEEETPKIDTNIPVGKIMKLLKNTKKKKEKAKNIRATPTRRISRSNSNRVKKKKGKALIGVINKGVSHGIKKPNKKIIEKKKEVIKKPTSEVFKPIMTTPKANKKDFEVSSKTREGSLNLSSVSKVSYEVKGGQVVFRKVRKPQIPQDLRRSPRKAIQRSSNKLFSPSSASNFLSPSPSKNKTAAIPSPVKFAEDPSLEKEVSTDVGSIIERLENDDDKENVVLVTDEELRKIAIETEEQIRELDLSENIQEILATIPQSLTVKDNEQFMEEDEVKQPKSSNVFPIFGKNSAKTGIQKAENSSKPKGKKFITSDSDERQMIIDAGQKKFGAQYCLTCSTLYDAGHPEDEKAHERVHSGFLDIIRFNRWKNERVVRHLEEFGRRILMIDLSSPKVVKHWEKAKVESVLSVIDKTLGSITDLGSLKEPKAFLYIADRMVVGFLLAEKISGEAHPMNEDRMTCNMEVKVTVKAGISRIWVMPEYQRQGIASRLVDAMRENFLGVLGQIIQMNEFAFSQTTAIGTDFAVAYTKTDNFLTYFPH